MQKPFSLFVIVFLLVLFSLDLSAQTTATKKAVIKPDPVPGYKTTQTDTPLLLVEMDYFVANSSQQGFFTVESYPISDGLPGIVNAVSTSIIGTNNSTFDTSFIVSDRIQIGEEVRRISSIGKQNLKQNLL
jgi:hypothetical protein